MDDSKNRALVTVGSQPIENDLTNVDIGGDYIGGNKLNVKFYLANKDAIQLAEHLEFVEQFSSKAAGYIVKVANDIALQSKSIAMEDLGFQNEKLNKKFQNMKCTPSYRGWFNEHAANFAVINQLRETDSFQSGAKVIRGVVLLIRQLYLQLLDKHDNGDKIHNAIFGYISRHQLEEEEAYATHSLIFYTIHECGIFNEEK